MKPSNQDARRDLAVLRRLVVLVEPRGVGGAHAGRVGEVLEADWHAAQRPDRLASHDSLLGRDRLRHGAVGRQRNEGADVAV